jgi:hypothetical protein
MMLLVVAILVATPAAPGAEINSAGTWMEQFRKANPDLAQLAETSSTVRPELGARMLLTIAASPRLKRLPWKRNLLLQAFETAALVRDPLPQASVLSGTLEGLSLIGTRAQLQESLQEEELDRLSLESDALAEMLKIDPVTARELFLRMPSPSLKRPACVDVFLEDPSPYYELLGEIVRVAFSGQERKEGRHVELLSMKIQEINSPLEVGPMSNVLRSTPLSMEERSFLISKLATAVGNMDLDDRSFSFSLAQTDENLHGLIAVSGSLGGVTEGLVAAYRSYLARGFSEARCADTARNDGVTKKIVDRFNGEFARDGDSRLRRLDITDLKPEKLLSEPEIPSFTPSVNELIQKILDLILIFPGNENGENGDGEADQETAKAAKLDDILRMFEEIEPALGEDQDSYLMRKGLAFTGVIASIPAGPERDKLLSRYVDFLNSAAGNSEDLAAWIGPLRVLLDGIEDDHAAKRSLLELLRRSPQAAVSFYARLEQLRQGER